MLHWPLFSFLPIPVTPLIVSRDQGFIVQMQGMVTGRSGEIYVATNWWEANRFGVVGNDHARL